MEKKANWKKKFVYKPVKIALHTKIERLIHNDTSLKITFYLDDPKLKNGRKLVQNLNDSFLKNPSGGYRDFKEIARDIHAISHDLNAVSFIV